MKLKITISTLIFGLILFAQPIQAQTKHVITLTVDVENINQGNLDETCSFGQPQGTSNEDFTVNVQVGDEVKWKRDREEDTNGNFKLIRFKHDNGKKFFKKDTINASFGRIKGTIEEGSPGDVEKYSIQFKVKKQGSNTWEEYTIDPKLKIM